MLRARFECVLSAALGIAFLSACSSPARAPEAADAAAQPTAHPEQALLEDLTVANRVLARQLAILDIQGHVTARSTVNPNHYYIARFVSPGGASVSDFIENDLDSMPVHGPRTDQAREIYLHGEIYKARPDAMAVVHAHTPEFVAFGMSSVPLWSGDRPVPVWDIRPFNRGRSGIVNTPALGKAMAEALGRSEAVLLWGHGIALTAASLPEALSRVDALRDSARLQEAAIDTGAAWKPQPQSSDAGDVERTWAYYKRAVLKETGGRVPTLPAPTPDKPADAEQAAAHDLVLANRILVSDELRVLDTLGHVSVRHPGNANRYLVAPRVAPGAATAADVMQRDIASSDADSDGLSIDAEIYKARPDVGAILYARTPEIVAFTQGSAKLRPVVNGAAFIGAGLPVFDVGTLDRARPLLANPALGQGVAAALGKGRGVLLAGHGFVLTARTIYTLVDNAYQLRANAIIQRQATALRGRVAFLNERPAEPVAANEPQAPAPTGPAEGRSWIYWSQNIALD
jgi:HCOMODA/2-hydroxy-3-carboxy-muconic semialdehyde decarboxylase